MRSCRTLILGVGEIELARVSSSDSGERIELVDTRLCGIRGILRIVDSLKVSSLGLGISVGRLPALLHQVYGSGWGPPVPLDQDGCWRINRRQTVFLRTQLSYSSLT